MDDKRPHRPPRGRPPSPVTVREIYQRLRSALGPLDPPRRLDPLEELVVTVLSQNTSDVNRDRAYAAMEAAVPPRLRVRMHVGLIRLGRQICRAGRPSCEVCPLQDLCPTAPSVLKARRAGPARGSAKRTH